MISRYAITTLVVYITSVFFAIRPVSIPTPRPIPRIPINLITAPILAITLLWAARCIDLAVIRNGIVGTEGVKPCNILTLFFSLAYIAITLDIAGILQAAASWISNKADDDPWKLYLYLYAMLTLLSILLGSHTVILSGTAFLVYYTGAATLDPGPWIMAEFAAASTASMVPFVGSPVNMIICEGFGLNGATFTAYTILPFLACSLFCFVALAFQHRHKIPLELTRAVHRDPRSALLDPVGAWVGGSMLVMALILCLAVSFFRIDAWMVSSPFTVGKLIFDLGWDHYRYSRGIPMLGRSSPKAVGKQYEEGPVVERPDTREMSPCVEASFTNVGRSPSFPFDEEAAVESHSETSPTQPPPSTDGRIKAPRLFRRFRSRMDHLHDRLDRHFPTLINALPRLPFTLVPLVFSQSILIEALHRQGWVDVFANWLVRASAYKLHPTIWLIGVTGVTLCNLLGTNIGATLLFTKIIRAAALPRDASRGAAIALAVASNIGVVGFTFSASLSGLLWRDILGREGVHVSHRDFALWNLFPLLVMVIVGFGIISAEMAVLYQS